MTDPRLAKAPGHVSAADENVVGAKDDALHQDGPQEAWDASCM